jgi:hypothetical protein
MLDVSRVRRGAASAFVVAAAGAAGLVAIALFFSVGQPFGTINDLLGLVMIAGLGPVMLAHYELGGPVPLWPARVSLGGGIAAVAGWAVLQAGFVLGLYTVHVEQAATGAWAVQAWLQVVIGLWVAGASLLAGRWLPPVVRTLGIVAGVGVVLMAVGVLRGGYPDLLTNVGGVGYQILLPIWAYLLGRVFRERAHSASGVVEAVPA